LLSAFTGIQFITGLTTRSTIDGAASVLLSDAICCFLEASHWATYLEGRTAVGA
jgi:hypothetical protein